MIQHECNERGCDVSVIERELQLELQGRYALVRRSWSAKVGQRALSQGLLSNY